jgi:hypothetical protein
MIRLLEWIEEAGQKLRCGLGFYDGVHTGITTIIELIPIIERFSLNKDGFNRVITLFTKELGRDK